MIRRILCSVPLLTLSMASFAAPQLSQYTAIRVQKANELALKEEYKPAIEALNSIDTSRDYDRAYVERMLGVFYWQAGNSQQAISHLKKAVESHLLEDEQGWTTQRMLADLLMTNQQYTQAISHYQALTKNVPQNQKAEEIWFRLAQAQYQVEQWAPVLSSLGQYQKFKAINEVPTLSLKLGAQLALERWKSAIPTLEKLVSLEPNKLSWWRQLVGLQVQTKQYGKALDTLALAKLNKLALSEQDLRLLAQLYAQRGIPERAALTLSELAGSQSELKLITQQAVYWQQAKEWDNAIEQWELASRQDSKYQWNLAQVLLQQGYYDRAIVALEKVEQRDKQRRVLLAKARAYYKLNELDKALVEAKEAHNIEHSKESESWIKFLTNLRKTKQGVES